MSEKVESIFFFQKKSEHESQNMYATGRTFASSHHENDLKLKSEVFQRAQTTF